MNGETKYMLHLLPVGGSITMNELKKVTVCKKYPQGWHSSRIDSILEGYEIPTIKTGDKPNSPRLVEVDFIRLLLEEDYPSRFGKRFDLGRHHFQKEVQRRGLESLYVTN